MTTFIHTADWHLGMTRRFLSPEAQSRYADARVQAVRDIAALATAEGAAFVVAAGDLFDSNHVDRQVVARALDAMAEFTVPVLILPGNHDALDAGSVYRSRLFLDRVPDLVTVIADSDPIDVAPGVQVVGAPCLTRHPGRDLAAAAIDGLTPVPGLQRVLVAHGVADVLSPDADDPALIRMASLGAALDAGVISYVALGDRHSSGAVGGDARAQYSGSPVSTDHGELDPGNVLVVSLGDGPAEVRAHRVGDWTFRRIEAQLNGMDDVERLGADLEALAGKQRTIVRLALVGAVGMAEDARLQAIIDHNRDLFASLTVSDGRSDLAVYVDDADLQDLGLSGYAYEAAAEIVALSGAEGPLQEPAQDALRLLYRLTRAS